MLNQENVFVIDFKRLITVSQSIAYEGLLQEVTGSPPSITNYNGFAKISVNATSQAQANRLHQGVHVPFAIADIKEVRVVMAANDFGALVEAGVGLADNPTDDLDNISEGVYWKIDPDNAVYIEADDNSDDDVSVAAGQSLGMAKREFVLDFHSGVLPQSPLKGGAVGARAHILASMTDANGRLKAVGRGSVISLDDSTARMQFFAQVSKASGTGTGAIFIERVEIYYKSQAETVTTTTTTTTAAPTTTTAGG